MAKQAPKIDISQAHTYGVSDEAALEFIEWRIMKGCPLTQRAFDRAMKVCLQCNIELGVPADRALEVVIDNGWRGCVFEYIKKNLANRQHAVATMPALATPEKKDQFIQRVTDRSWSQH